MRDGPRQGSRQDRRRAASTNRAARRGLIVDERRFADHIRTVVESDTTSALPATDEARTASISPDRRRF